MYQSEDSRQGALNGSSRIRRLARLRVLEVAAVLLVVALSVALSWRGIAWGLPSAERSQYYPRTVGWYEAEQGPLRLYQTAPYESYHPDEGAIPNRLSNMVPARLDLDPKDFVYPTLHVYLTGAVIGLDLWMRGHDLSLSKEYVLRFPEVMANAYLAGRYLAVFMAAACVAVLYGTARVLFGPVTAYLSAIGLSVTPLWVRDAHFMAINVPAAFWMTLACFFACLGRTKKWGPGYMLGALASGLAASTKYPAGVVILCVLFAVPCDEERSRATRRWVSILALALIGFLIGTPYALLSGDAFLRDVQSVGQFALGVLPFSWVLTQLILAQGVILAVLSVVGVALLFRRWRSWPHQFTLVWLAASLIQRAISDEPFYRYLILALPPLAVASGVALAAAVCSRSMQSDLLRRATGLVATMSLLLHPLGLASEVGRVMSGADIRTTAAAWIEHATLPGSSIGILKNLFFDMPPVNAERVHVVELSDNKLPSTSMAPVYVVVPSSQRHLLEAQPLLRAWLDAHYSVAVTYHQEPRGFWWLSDTPLPQDWYYTFLSIEIFVLKSDNAIEQSETAISLH